MASLTSTLSGLRSSRLPFDARLSVLIAGLAGVSLLMFAVPTVAFVWVAPGADIAINTTAVLTAGVVLAFTWSRFREEGRREDLLEAAAFATLLASGILFLNAPLAGLDDRLGMSLAAPSDTPLYIWTAARAIAALALIGAGRAIDRSAGPRPRTGNEALMALAVAVFIGASVVVVMADGALPALIPPEGLEHLRAAPVRPDVLPGVTPLAILSEVLVTFLFLYAAALYARRPTERGNVRHWFMAAALLFAAASQLHMAIYPGSYTGLVNSSDLLRLAFYATLFIGIQVQIRADNRSLRRANAELGRLREADVERATLEERARLAREVHDGLAQDLWLAKLKVGRLATVDGLPAQAQQLTAEVEEAVDAGLAEARRAVGALRASSETAGLDGALDDCVHVFAEGSDLVVDYDRQGAMPTLTQRVQTEIMRIVQEALANVRRHADATTVRVRVRADDGWLHLSIEDNGRGFDSAGPEGFGLEIMRERADAIGATLAIRSAPQDGTVVQVSLPVAEGSAA